MFKLAHIADIHAGYKATRLLTSNGLNLREADGYVALSKCFSEIIEQKPDALVISGDVFHTPNPEIRTIVFVQNQFRRLWKAGIPIYSLTGNHDTNDVKADMAASRVLHDPWRNIYSHVEPYAHHEIADGIHLHLVSHHMYREQATTMQEVKPIDGEINIFTTHGSCIDPILQHILHTEQSPREIVIPDSLLRDRDWSYTILGHIHERGWVGSKDGKTDTSNSKIYYNGSLLRRGFSDKETPLGRGWTLWNIDDEGVFTPKLFRIPERPQVDFPIIDAKDLSSDSVTEIILKNLQSTQLDGTNFDSRSAPILRQRIANLSPMKYSGIDWKTIDLNSSHAMSWEPKLLTNTIQEETDENEQNISSTAISDNADILKVYDDWKKDSPSLQEVKDKKLQDEIAEQARNFVKVGQEETLESE